MHPPSDTSIITHAIAGMMILIIFLLLPSTLLSILLSILLSFIFSFRFSLSRFGLLRRLPLLWIERCG